MCELGFVYACVLLAVVQHCLHSRSVGHVLTVCPLTLRPWLHLQEVFRTTHNVGTL